MTKQAIQVDLPKGYQLEEYNRFCESELHEIKNRPKAIYMTIPNGLFARYASKKCLNKKGY